eukprot:TRINITY_DN34824_c0_g1_i1.p1 TRINITY_DN34824_c0_g1~~TRINITY_DN34824_c0_g1_i1.p1  ORF type:complete len:353 (+),score=64.65 TRINITY_DN34824_c0_g1_i1:56-1114(+)
MAEMQSVEDLEEQWAELTSMIDNLQEFQANRRSQGQAVLEQMKAQMAKLESGNKQLEADQELISRKRKEVEGLRCQLDEEKSKMQKAGIGNNDLIGLNLGGERVVMVKRSLLLQFENSMLARMFSGRYEDRLDRDKDGNVFLDYSPTVMLPLIEFLRLYRDSSPEDYVQQPKIEESLQPCWHRMLRFFELQQAVKTRVAQFSGIKQNQKPDLRGWWTSFRNYDNYGPHHPKSMADFIKHGGPGRAILIVVQDCGNVAFPKVALAAMGYVDIVTKPRNEPVFHNGAYWFCDPDQGYFGFGSGKDLSLESDDKYIWRLDKKGGFRVGSDRYSFDDGRWETRIYDGFMGNVHLSD